MKIYQESHIRHLYFTKRKVKVYDEKIFKIYSKEKEKSSKRVWTYINFIIVSQLKNYRWNYLHFYGHHEKSFELNSNIYRRDAKRSVPATSSACTNAVKASSKKVEGLETHVQRV